MMEYKLECARPELKCTWGTRGYTVQGENQSLEHVWSCEQIWFLPGTEVTITDENGNSKTFIRERP